MVSKNTQRARFALYGARGIASRAPLRGTVRYDPANPDRERPIQAVCARIERETRAHCYPVRHDSDNVNRDGEVTSSIFEITITRPVARRYGGGHTVLGVVWAVVSKLP